MKHKNLPWAGKITEEERAVQYCKTCKNKGKKKLIVWLQSEQGKWYQVNYHKGVSDVVKNDFHICE